MPCLPNLGSKAPDFTVNTTFGPINLSDYCGKWVVLFSHPGDFTQYALLNLYALRSIIMNLKREILNL